MRPRDAVILDPYTLADSETHIIDLNVNQPITALQIMYYAQNGSTNNLSNWLSENISKIELVDGSEVLFSLSAEQAQGLAFYGGGVRPRNYLREDPSQNQYCDIWVLFGRYLYDELLAFDATKYSNPQLKLTHNLATITAVGVTGFTADSCNVRVIAKLMEEAPAPTGFLMSKEHYNWDTGSSSLRKYLDLPTDYPYRMIGFRVHVENKQGHEILQEVKMNIDQGSYIPFDLTGSDLANFGLALRGYAKAAYLLHSAHNSTHDLILYNGGRHGMALGGGNSPILYTPHGGGNRLTVSAYDTSASASYSTLASLFFEHRGVCFQDVNVYNFGRVDVIEDWLDVTKFGSVRIEALTEGWSASASLILQQLRTY
jgi:hypothetical protein